MLSVPNVGSAPLVQQGTGATGQAIPETGAFDFLSYFLGLQADPFATPGGELDQNVGLLSGKGTSLVPSENLAQDKPIDKKDQSLWDGLFLSPSLATTPQRAELGELTKAPALDKELVNSGAALSALRSREKEGSGDGPKPFGLDLSTDRASTEFVDAWNKLMPDRAGQVTTTSRDQATEAYASLGRMQNSGEASRTLSQVGHASLTERPAEFEVSASGSSGKKSDKLALDSLSNTTIGTKKRTQSFDSLNALSSLDGGVLAKGAGNFSGIASQGMSSEKLESASIPDLLGKVETMAYHGGGKMVVKLNPPSLGEVQVQVTTHGNRVEIEMSSANSSTKSLLENSLGDLVQSIESQDMVVSRMEVQLTRESDLGSESQLTGNFGGGSETSYQSQSSRNQSGSDHSPTRLVATREASFGSSRVPDMSELRAAPTRSASSLVDLRV